MRDKGLVFEEMRRVRRSLGLREGRSWIEVAVGVALIGLAAAASVLR